MYFVGGTKNGGIFPVVGVADNHFIAASSDGRRRETEASGSIGIGYAHPVATFTAKLDAGAIECHSGRAFYRAFDVEGAEKVEFDAIIFRAYFYRFGCVAEFADFDIAAVRHTQIQGSFPRRIGVSGAVNAHWFYFDARQCLFGVAVDDFYFYVL